MKKKSLLLLLLVVMLFSFTACEKKEEKKDKDKIVIEDHGDKEPETKKEKTLTIESDTGDIYITVPDTWKQMGAGELNKEANLELGGIRSDKYLMNISDTADNFNSFQKWLDIVIPSAQSNYKFDKSKVEDVKVNGYNAKYIDFDASNQGVNMHMYAYYIETSKYYSQLYMWTTKAKQKTYENEFKEIIQTFKEVS